MRSDQSRLIRVGHFSRAVKLCGVIVAMIMVADWVFAARETAVSTVDLIDRVSMGPEEAVTAAQGPVWLIFVDDLH